jgi:ribosomal protein S18 acetylase RimI-like enzyme
MPLKYHEFMFNIRLARPSDIPLIVDFQLSMAEESEGVALDRDTLTAGVTTVFAGNAHAGYWIAEQEGAAKGMAMTVPEWSDWRNGTVVWIHSVYVSPDSRRQGAFRAIYEHLFKTVESTDELKGLRLYVDKTNERAQQVYEAMGMTREHYHLYEWLKHSG